MNRHIKLKHPDQMSKSPNFGKEDSKGTEEDSEKYMRKRKRRSDEDESEDEAYVSSSEEYDSQEETGAMNSRVLKAHRKCLKRIGQAVNKYTINILKY